jgi:hypothetical protein
VTHVGNNTSGGGTSASHNVAIDTDSGFLYRCGGGSSPVEGLRVYNLANPANPVSVGTWNSRYVHDAQIVTYTSGPNAGKQIAFCYAEDSSGGGNAGLAIVDVTNKSSMFEVSFTPYSNAAFSHQGWLSSNGQVVSLNDELDESSFGSTTTTRIINVSNINSPFEAGTFTNGNTSIDHNLYTRDDQIFAANYRSGLRIFDASNVNSPVEVGYFDTYPDDDGVDFNGLWSVYPYFPSGVVIGSDLERGLFVWWVGDPLITLSVAGGLPGSIDPVGEVLTVNIAEDTPGDLAPGTANLFLDSGSGFTQIALADQGGGVFQASVPAHPCGTPLSYYFSAESTNGIAWTEPAGAPTLAQNAVAQVAETVSYDDDMETNLGWTVGAPGDNATTGIWTRVDPNGTSAQPEDDHSADPASQCWVTGQGSFGGSVGENDVDSGVTTLRSPFVDVSTLNDPYITYWRWYNNIAGAAPGADVFVVDVSTNGSTWFNVETVGPTGLGTTGGWIQHRFRVADFVSTSGSVQLRFQASDLGSGSIVEAAVDDLQVLEAICTKPTVVAEGDFQLGGEVTVRYLMDAGDSIYAVYGLPPQISVPVPPYNGTLCISPFQNLFLIFGWGSDEFQLSGTIPNVTDLIGVQILLQALIGPSLGGPSVDATWTNCEVIAIQ